MLPAPTEIEHDGWRLEVEPYQDGDGFWTDEYYAVRGEERRHLHHSRFSFTPTQERVAYLIDAGFPSHPPRPEGSCLGPWSDKDVDEAIEKLRRQS